MQLIGDERQALTFTGGLEWWWGQEGAKGALLGELPSEQLGHFKLT